MANSASETYFDRRMPEALMSALRKDGFAHSLVEYARSGQYGLDLGLRAGPKSSESWASLYVGTTKALDLLHHPKRGFRLKVDKKPDLWRPSWQTWQPAGRLEERWPEVERFIEGCIRKAAENGRHLKEGVVQAGVSRFGEGNPFVVDREAVVGFRDQPTKRRLLAAQRRPLAHALRRTAAEPNNSWLTLRLSSTECDLLAVDATSGDLLTVEVKPEGAGPATALAPLQAWQYAQQFQAWAHECVATGADSVEVVLGMYRQRSELGLSDGREEPRVTSPLVVRPAVALRPGCSLAVRKRLATVVRTLRGAELDEPPMRFFTVNLVGRLDAFDPLDVDSW